MTSYLLTYIDGQGLIVRENGNNKGTVSIADLLKGLGGGGDTQVKNTQQEINYLDCIKDGTNVNTLKQLNIFPILQTSGFPTYNDDLHALEDNIIKAHSGQIETAYWHKTKPNGSTAELNKSKIYEEVLWEAGLGPKWFVKKPGNGIPTYIKTFGSFIDPLEKNNADKTWPSNNNTVKIDRAAMTAMGFPNCELEATTKAGDNFTFKMTIGTGNGCTPCVITEKTPNFTKYFAGNKTKNAALKTKGGGPSTDEKVKMIMVKEWGDKMQCLIYLLKQMSGGPKSVMSSCDKVVYVLCLLLKVPFIYSGYDGSPNAPKYKHYAISHFQPIDDPVKYMQEQCENAKLAIASNNEGFIDFLKTITPDTKFRLANTYDVYKLDPNNGFIPGCILDIVAYTQDAVDRLDAHLATIGTMESMSPTSAITQMKKAQQKTQLGMIEIDIASIKEQDTVVPFIKVKKGTKAHLTCNQTSSYTLKPRNHPNQTLLSKPNLKQAFETFYGATDIDDETFARIPFFQLIRGKNKNGLDLILSSDNKVSEIVPSSGGGSKNKQNGGNKYENFVGDTVVNVSGVYFPSDTIPQLESAAQLIGYIPDPADVSTWDQYIVKGIMEVPKEGHDSVDPNGELFINSDLLTNENLEANLITGLLDYCARVGNMNYFDTLYNTSIYQGIISAGAQPVSDGAAGDIAAPIPLFPEYNVDNSTVFDAALNSFFGDDSIIGVPGEATPIIPVTSADLDGIEQYKQLWCRPQLIENEIDSALIESIEQEEREAAGAAAREQAVREQKEREAADARRAAAAARLLAARQQIAKEQASRNPKRKRGREDRENILPNQQFDPYAVYSIQKKGAIQSPFSESLTSMPRAITAYGGKKTKKNKRKKRKTRYKKNKRNNKKTKRNIKRKNRKTRNKTKLGKKNKKNKKTRREKRQPRKQTRRQRRK